MINTKDKIVIILIEKGNELLKQPYKYIGKCVISRPDPQSFPFNSVSDQ